MSKISFKKALLKGKLFKKVTIVKDTVHFELNEAYDDPSKFKKFLKNLFATRPISFSQKFIINGKGNSDITLELKEDAKGLSPVEIIEQLQSIANINPERTFRKRVNQGVQNEEQSNQVRTVLMESRKRLPWRKLLLKGELIESLSIEGESVKVTIKEPYDKDIYYPRISGMLNLLSTESEALKLRYSNMGHTKNGVGLILQNTECQDPDILLNELIAAAAPSEKINFCKDLRNGVLIKSIQKQNDEFTIIFDDKYDNPKALKRIKKSYNLFLDGEPALQQAFSKVSIKDGVFNVKLKEGYFALTEEEILTSLRTKKLPKESPKGSLKGSPKENFKENPTESPKEECAQLEEVPVLPTVASFSFLPFFELKRISSNFDFTGLFDDISLTSLPMPFQTKVKQKL